MYQLRKVRVESAEVGADDEDEEEDAPRELEELPAIGPLNAVQLRPDRHEEGEKPTAMGRLCSGAVAAVAADAARTGRRHGAAGLIGQLLVVDLEVGGRRLGVAEHGVAADHVLRRG